MKGKFFTPFYCLPFKRIICQHRVWSVHTNFVLIVVQHCSWFYFMMCLHDDRALTSTSSWAVVRKKTLQMSFHLMANRWSHWHDFFCLFSFFQKMLVFAFLYCLTSLCLHPLSYNPINGRRSSDHVHTVVHPFYFVTQPLNNTECHVVFWVGGMCLSVYFQVVDVAAFCLTEFKHFYSMFVGLSFEINSKEYMPSKWALSWW